MHQLQLQVCSGHVATCLSLYEVVLVVETESSALLKLNITNGSHPDPVKSCRQLPSTFLCNSCSHKPPTPSQPQVGSSGKAPNLHSGGAQHLFWLSWFEVSRDFPQCLQANQGKLSQIREYQLYSTSSQTHCTMLICHSTLYNLRCWQRH
jgi:hypothetical protein